MKFRKEFFIIILLFWMILIFAFSNQNVTSSLSLSDKISEEIIDIGMKITGKHVSPTRRTKLIRKTRMIVRKTAHFTEYFILGILVYLIFEMYSIPKSFVYAILFCFLYACSDEFHQLFSDGRSARILDIILDTSGSVTSISSYCLIKTKKSKSFENEK